MTNFPIRVGTTPYKYHNTTMKFTHTITFLALALSAHAKGTAMGVRAPPLLARRAGGKMRADAQQQSAEDTYQNIIAVDISGAASALVDAPMGFDGIQALDIQASSFAGFKAGSPMMRRDGRPKEHQMSE